ncbi:MAG: sulfatase-like hydrolase/transferase [Deltaproteobacteria bacterium]|nr:sulfatase-like hydrolase/transferase [Deltaproteobacteria bacterium]
MLLYRSVRDAATADVGRAITMAAGGAIAFAPIEYVATLSSYAGSSALASKLRLAALTVTLSLLLFLILAVVLSLIMLAARAVRAQLDPIDGRGTGWFVPTPIDEAGIRRGVPAVWAGVVSALVLGLVLQRGAAEAMKTFKEPQLTAGLIAVLGLVVVAVSPLVFRGLVVAATLAARALAPILGSINPLGRWRASSLALAGLVGGTLAVCWFALPQSRSVLPVRTVAAATVIALGLGIGALVHARMGERTVSPHWFVIGGVLLAVQAVTWFLMPSSLWAIPGRIVIVASTLILAMLMGSQLRVRPRTRRRAVALAAAAGVLSAVTFMWWGADLETKYVAITASPTLERLIGVVRLANDLDRDGFGTILGEADCAPFDKKINPGAIDVPDDHIDQNCDGRDFSMASITAPTGPTVSVPPQFKKPWNVLLITIDTVRYDRTSFGGYKTGPKQRDTTPKLAELVSRSTSFTFANAPSAGTMASIPAILTSKFFHSGIAIGDVIPGQPPKILPENTTLPEIMKRAGYTTGVIGSHEWWNDWGLEQGVDDYDNSIGKTGDPYRVAADKVTDHALAWISRQQGKKWFMWAHYIDPHGRYVAHPNVVDWGTAETDLYDAELKWTDQELGRLFAELRRLPSSSNTIIVITSDHGDSMAEHNIPLGTHGTALYREMLHVPLIFYVPDNAPRTIGGAVTPLDIVPTLAELCGIDVKDLSFEGRSLVPALFAGREDKDRIVFAETNAPKRQRAAISEAWKLIFYLHTNVFELFDLKADPWEKDNLAPKAPPALGVMKQALQLWMDRVLYARDPLFNHSFRQMQDVITSEPPPIATTNQTLAGGAIEIIGIGPAAGKPLAPGAKTEIHVYFRAKQAIPTQYRFQLVAWPGTAADPVAPGAIRSAYRSTAEGAFGTHRWKAGDLVRERFALTIPPDWKGESIVVGLVAGDVDGTQKVTASGPAPANDLTVAILGTLPVQTGSSPPPGP